VSDVVVDRNHLDSLLEAMLQVPGLTDSDVRDAQVEKLTRLLRRTIDAARFADSRHDLTSLINACLACSGGLRTFARILHEREPGDASARVVELADEVMGPSLLSASDRDALRRLLAGISVGQIADAVGELVEVEAAELRTLQVWRDLPNAIRMLESLPTPDDGVPQLLTFTDRLAHVVSGTKALQLRRWVDTVAGGLGVEQDSLAHLRATSERGVAGGRLSAPPQRSPSEEEFPTPRPRRSDESGLIWGAVPIRNRNFSGRVALLDRLGDALRTTSKASVLPQTLHGMGGVGKTQLVIEYVYRHMNEYDIVWWIAAEQPSSVLSSLAQLAERLGLTTTEDRQQTARTVLDALAGTELSWLLVYDNADDPALLDQYVPSTGGHVILTTRNQEWATLGQPIEVDVFERHESIELLQRRSTDDGGAARIHTAEADELAEKLGDLPLALEQAVAWYLATAMPIKEYIELLDSHMKDLLSEGKPANYPVTVAAFVTLAVEQLRVTAPAAAQMFELFAYLGGEPVPVSLLRRGKDASITEPLRSMLGSTIPTNRTVRDLNRFGLAKVDALQRVQVHRLVQRVLRDSLPTDLASQTLRNTQQLLATADPGDPDENPEVSREDMGPHLDPADMINAADVEARLVVLNHARYLYTTGDYENSLRLAERAARAWARDTSHQRLGADGELTLRAQAQIANAHRALGKSREAEAIARETFERFKTNPTMGPRHEYTLITGNQVAADLRIAGRYREALEFDQESVALHRDVFGADDNYTLRARVNLAVDYRMIGDFAEAYRVDTEVADRWEDVSASDPRALAAYMNLARSCYGLGAYRVGLDLMDRWRHALQLTLGAGNSHVLLAGRTHAILLRKLGRLEEALEVIRENQERMQKRFGPNHEFAVAATASYANVLRDVGELEEATQVINEALDRYRTHFGPLHPLTLVAQVNEAVLLRARGQLAAARAIDESCYRELSDVLAADHPYTICAGVGLATDHARAGEHQEALALSTSMYELSKQTSGGGHSARDGGEHPYVLMRGVNLSIDMRATGDRDGADALLAESVEGLRQVLSPEHPEVIAIEHGARTEGDIEPPPT
jgi:tetratricopeptide (TPR) repeat protein